MEKDDGVIISEDYVMVGVGLVKDRKNGKGWKERMGRDGKKGWEGMERKKGWEGMVKKGG